MRFLKKLFLTLLILAALLFGFGFLLPSQYNVERTVEISSTDEAVFNLVNDLEKMQIWSPWKAIDPSLTVEYGLTKSGQGASYFWKSEKSGEGTLTISESTPFSKIVTDLDFKQSGLAKGIFLFEPKESGLVNVTWQLSGDNGYNIVGRYFGMAMDSLIGPVFEDGLKRLKQEAEKSQ